MRAVTKTSDLQFYFACSLTRVLARPRVDAPYARQRRDLNRLMRCHRAFDDLRNCGKSNASVKKPRDGNLVRGVQHTRKTSFRIERSVRKPQTWKRLGIGRVEFELSRTNQIEARQRRGPPFRIRKRVLKRQAQ